MTSLPTHVLEAGAAAARVAPEILDEAVRLALIGGPDTEIPGWQDDALCHGAPVDAYYPTRGAGLKELRAGCGRCPVQSACLAYAIWSGEREGWWGGTSARGRQKLRQVLRQAGVLGAHGEDAYLAWIGDGADRRRVRLHGAVTPVTITPRPHQDDAVASVCAEIRDGGSCQIAMATASGKTHVGLWVAEQLDARRVLVLVPNLALVAQTAELWQATAATPLDVLAVCSDTGDSDLDATTDPDHVADFLRAPGRRSVVFATYQSSAVLVAAGVTFDLAIADEAHHLAGEADKPFAAVVRGEIPTRRTLYMTATPRRFRRQKLDVELVGMDDPAFGPRVYELVLSDAVAEGIVADYRVIVAAVDRDTFERVARHPDLQDVDPHLLAGAIAVVRAMGDNDLGSCVSFHSRIERARTFASLVGVVAEAMPTTTPASPGWSGFLHGGSSVRIRRRLLDRLVDTSTWGVVANAKTLGEGVDVPTLDSIAIVDPKTSEQDVMQAVGRALRRPGQTAKTGTVLLPVLLAADHDPDDPLAGVDPRSIDTIAGVLRALRGHDADLSSRLDRIRRSLGKRQPGGVDEVLLDRFAMRRRAARGLLRSRLELHLPGGSLGDLAGALSLKLIRDSTSSWEEAYGRLVDWIGVHGAMPGQIQKVADDTDDGFALGAWCGAQRISYQRGLLDPNRVARLEEIPEWSWTPREEQWWRKLEALKTYVALTGEIPSRAYEVTIDGVDVGSFVNVTRSAYNDVRPGKAWIHKFPDRIAALEAIPGWVWNVKDAEWELHFSQLERWVKAAGHANPGAGETVDGFDVGKWVQKQRSRIRGNSYVDRRRGGVIREETLSPERTARLRALPGWVEHTREASWEAGYQRLVAYVEEHGELPPQSYKTPDGHHVGGWMLKQRQVWLRDHRNGKKQKGFLGPDRERLLEQVPGWTWVPMEDAWQAKYDALLAYVAAGGDPGRIPQDLEVDGNRLGSWVIGVRMKHRRGELDAERVALLEQIPGWEWDGRVGAARAEAAS